MSRFLFRRIISAVLALFIVSTLTFFIMQMVPGGPFNSERANAKTIAIMEAKYGFNRPIVVQYADYMKNLLKGDLGIPVKKVDYTVNEIIAEKFPVSARLGLVAISWAVLMGVTMGIFAAVKHNKPIDRILMFICTIGVSVPGFVVATLLLYFFGLQLKLLPAMRLDTPLHYIMPAFALSLSPMCYITRLTRSNMLDVLSQDYIKTARAKGLSKFKIYFKHALRNSVIPVVSYLGPLTAITLTGTFVVERVFSVPGLGSYFISSISNRDYPMIMGTTIFLATILVTMNLIVDIVYGIIDPRIKYD